MKKSCAILIGLVFFINNINLVNGQELCKIYYLEDTFDEKLTFDEYLILGDFMEEYKIKLILETYFYNSKKNINYIPDGAKILNVKLINKDLFINFNKNIENYGGNHYETNFIRQILHTCFQFEDIGSVSFLIDGKFKVLPEGNLVFKYTRDDLEILDYNQSLNLKENKN